ncbi:amino acid permease [Enterococcus columbae]|uniref:Amino acid permease n=1 Tax=Enterococcus columbae DSM 7374 = ATCC 51263 TaxID=1121865 RepID=S0KL34_9ENTE|nr:amino acid permease [Enterococcus columbae]EOT39916.1 amino acid permease [Enterococcus columbae DSM 7374 = ATCC 51263]EOW83901.1 amino acid permease [Enterococcus columbae DSM 7374 = ATCC 51263]OJG20555.1 amino acid permease [Enterococcus columbae DSM 7374 = ATCC 51263]
MDLFRKKSMQSQTTSRLKKNLHLKDLILLGIGAVIGTGIFVVTGQAAATLAGPALTLSFVVAAFVVILSGFSFAEFASRIPVLGGAYSYMYVVFGELIAWLTGWFLICEYLLAVASVASGWSAYFQGFLSYLGFHLPKALTAGFNLANGTYFDLIAGIVVILVTLWVTQEAKKALSLNNFMVWVKFGIIALFIIVGAFFVKPANWQPYIPFGAKGVIDGAALVFFAFLGFDAIAMAAEEVHEPQKNIPRGMIGAIAISTVLYIVVTAILTGLVPYKQLGVNDPVAFAMRFLHLDLVGSIISIGAILTLLTVTISMMYSLARLVYAISKDGLLPKALKQVDERHHTPKNATYVSGIVVFFFATVFPLNILAELTNIVALAYLILMAYGIIHYRKVAGLPKPGEFKVPFVPFLPLLSILFCLALMIQLSLATWVVFVISLVIGLGIYFGYGYKHSQLNQRS